jgi:nucleoside-diphosphate-sugar epimerase
MKLLVTGATGFLGWRTTTLLLRRGHEVVALARPGGARRAAADELESAGASDGGYAGPAGATTRRVSVVRIDAGDAKARDLIEGCDAVLHFAGVPDPAGARADPAGAVRANVGTTLNLLEGCRDHGVGLVYPSTVRAAADPPPDVYALSKRLGEEACRLHPARAAVLRLTSIFGPGQVAWEGATGAIAIFAARALEGAPIVIPGDPQRQRDFVYVDDLIPALEQIVQEGRWGHTLTLASGVPTPLLGAAELVRRAAGSASTIETPGGKLPAGENESYAAGDTNARLDFPVRPLEEAVQLYVDWLSRHPAAESRARA